MITLLNVDPENNTPQRLDMLMSRMKHMSPDDYKVVYSPACKDDAVLTVLFAKTHKAAYIVVDAVKPAQFMTELFKELLFWYKVQTTAHYTVKGVIVLGDYSCHTSNFNFEDYLEIDKGLERRKALLEA